MAGMGSVMEKFPTHQRKRLRVYPQDSDPAKVPRPEQILNVSPCITFILERGALRRQKAPSPL
jgi:hypothetical protein